MEKSIIKMLQERCVDIRNRRFIVDAENVLLACETGEQAGIVDFNEDYACAFKTEMLCVGQAESPGLEFAEVAGKLYREMSVCGSQPLVSLLSVSASELSGASDQMAYDNAIREIAAYENTLGVPVASVDSRKVESSRREISVNMLAVGLIDKSEQPVSICRGTGNPVYLVGAPDVGGKSVAASAFVTRSLYELICDLHDENAIVAIRNIDRGGIIFACAALVAAGTKGIELNTDVFDDDFPEQPADGFLNGELEMTGYIHEGKMILILREDFGKRLEKACHRWNMRCMQIGAVIDEHRLKVKKGETLAFDLPAESMSMLKASLPAKNIDLPVDAVPVAQSQKFTKASIPEESGDVSQFIASRLNMPPVQKIAEQFDSTVGTNNLSTNYISDAAVLQIKGARHAIAASFCSSLDDVFKYPEAINVNLAEALRRVVCSGGEPRAITGCLAYGGIISEKTMNAINDHIAAFCKKTGVATSGMNIRQTGNRGKAVIHNLSAGAIAFMDDKRRQMTISFKAKGDVIFMLGKSSDNLDSSEYLRHYDCKTDSPPQRVDMDVEVKLLRATRELIAHKFVKSVHSISRGGLFMSLLESAMVRSFGFDLTVDDEIRKDAFLFGESPSRIVVSVSPSREANFIDFMMKADVPFMTLGHVTREEIRIDDNSYGFISDYRKKYLA